MRETAVAQIGFRGLYAARFSKEPREEDRSIPATDKNSNQAFHKVNGIKSFLASGLVNEFEMQRTCDV